MNARQWFPHFGEAGSINLPIVITLSLFLGGCSQLPALWRFESVEEKPVPLTLGELKENGQNLVAGTGGKTHFPESISLPITSPSSSVSKDAFLEEIDQVVGLYRPLLQLSNGKERRTIDQRIGDLLVKKAEHLLALERLESSEAAKVMTENEQRSLAEARNHYNAMVQEGTALPSPLDFATEAHILYQEAKVLELSGEREKSIQALTKLVQRFPQSDYRVEAWFRIGEQAFTQGQYRAAEHAFTQIIETLASQTVPGQDIPITPPASEKQAYLQQAYYMAGWSRFKLGQYARAQQRFLDYWDLVWTIREPVFAKGLVTQSQDVLRAMVTAFDYLEGEETLIELFNQQGARPYEVVVYQHYVEWLKGKDRLGDAIRLSEAFIHNHPSDPRSPGFAAQKVALTEQLLGSQAAWEAKAHYLREYGPIGTISGNAESDPRFSALWAHPEHWQWNRQAISLGYAQSLAEHHYVMGQNLSGEASKTSFLLASRYYDLLLQGWPEEPSTGRNRFLKAESLYAGEAFQEAAEVYKKISYGDERNQHSEMEQADSAYALIDSLRHLATAGMEEAFWTEVLQAEQMFLQQFERDPRTPAVYSDALALSRKIHLPEVNLALALHLEEALRENRIQSLPPQYSVPSVSSEQLLQMAFSHQTGSLLALQSFNPLEQTVTRALSAVNWPDDKRQELLELKALALYRQAEKLEPTDRAQAVSLYLRAASESPRGTVGKSARQDAIALLLADEQWNEAIPLLESYVKDYPQQANPEGKVIQLAMSLERVGQWQTSAQYWEAILFSPPPVFEQPESELVWHIAQLYDKAGVPEKAIQHYRHYANSYPEPLLRLMQAQDRLIDLYTQKGDRASQAFWVARVIESFKTRKVEVGQESMTVVRRALRWDLSDKQRMYEAIRLSSPLKLALLKKKNALKALVEVALLLAQTGDIEAANESLYLTGEVYRKLALDLLESPAPQGLNELELSQYALLLEELAFPFEEKAIALHEQNMQHLASGTLNSWTLKSLNALKGLLPVRYDKTELGVSHSEQIN